MNERDEKESKLLESRAFEGIPEAKLVELAQVVQEKVVPPGTTICRQDDPGDSFYLIKSGKVRVFRKEEEGIETELSMLGTGESFGEMALITGEPRSAWVEAVQETSLMILPKDEFDRILKDHPQVALSFVKKMSKWLHNNAIQLEQEAQFQYKAPRISWLDYVLIIGITLLCGAIFNLSNPNGISFFPQSWSDEPLPQVQVSLARDKHAAGETIFVDARPATFYDKQHIQGAVNVPLALFDIVYLLELGETDKSLEIIVYGRNISSHYDEQVARKLVLRGHQNVKILPMASSRWKEKGYPVEP
jgi:rhodanese-related sulfurtransferase